MKGFFSSSEVQLDKPDAGLVPKCGACGLYKHCRSPKMPVYGKGERQILVVGEAPGGEEDSKGRPFVGESGQYLRGVLESLRIDLGRDAWTTNAVICRPEGNKTPDDKQIGFCRPNIIAAIERFKPKIIITLGRSALSSVLAPYWREIGMLERWTGWQIPLPDFWVCPTFHPSYVLRMRSDLVNRRFRDDLRAAFGIKHRTKVKDYKSKVEVLLEERQIVKALTDIAVDGGWVAVDYETNCLKPEYPKARIHSCAVSNGERTISYPWSPVISVATGALLHTSTTKKIASNLKFEERWTRKEYGKGVVGWGWDTMLATHCLDNRPGICSLKFQALVRLGVETYNANIEPYLAPASGHYNRIEEIDLDTLLLYGGMDGALEYDLAMLQREDMMYED